MKNKPARLQSGVVPFVRANGMVYVCLIRMKHERSNKGWGLPKGGAEPKMTLEDSALKEAMEEAGLLGKTKKRLGITEYTKGNDRRQHVTWFSMKVTKSLDKYDEVQIRERRWFLAEEAITLLPKDVAKIVRKAVQAHGLKDKDSKFIPAGLDDI